jgi:hypothetical protein
MLPGANVALYLCGHTRGGQIRPPDGRPLVTALTRCLHAARGLRRPRSRGHRGPLTARLRPLLHLGENSFLELKPAGRPRQQGLLLVLLKQPCRRCGITATWGGRYAKRALVKRSCAPMTANGTPAAPERDAPKVVHQVQTPRRRSARPTALAI